MSNIQNYFYDSKTHEFLKSAPAQLAPNGEPLPALLAVQIAPPETGDKQAAVWNGEAWEVVEDHRQHVNEQGVKEGGTPYWLSEEGDGYQSPERYMEDLGPLPEGAVTVRPEKPAPTVDELAAEVRGERDRRLTATDTMMVSDYTVHDVPLTDTQREELAAYRHALKVLPKQEGFPWQGANDPACPWPATLSFMEE